MFAEYAINGIHNRNNIKEIDGFNLPENTEAYRSIFLFTEDLKVWVNKTKSVKDFEGEHTADVLLFDFDSEDLEKIKLEVVEFCRYLESIYEIPFNYLQIYFSGNKGFHVGIPFECITNKIIPSYDFYKHYKQMALDLAGNFNVDTSIYELKRLFRITNSLHTKTNLYKIPISFNELVSLDIEQIKKLAKQPRVLETEEYEVIKSLEEIYNKLFIKKGNNEHSKKKNEILDIIKIGCSEGERHKALIRIAAMFVSNGFDFEFTYPFLELWNQKNNPPLPDERLKSEALRVFNDNQNQKKEDIKIYSLRDAANEYKNYVERLAEKKVLTGFEIVDKKIRGIMPGETCCIIGKTSVGKSAFLQNIGLNHALKSKEPVLFFSLEMPINSVFERTIQISSGFAGLYVEDGYKNLSIDVMRESEKSFLKYPNFYTITKSGLGLDDIKYHTKRAEQIYHSATSLILIDYLGLVKGNGNSNYEKVSDVARGIKDLAKDLDVPIIFLSQVTKKDDKYSELELGSARDSGVIDEASDFVLGIWEEVDKRLLNEQIDKKIKLGVLKNRRGSLGQIDISMTKKNLQISEMKKAS